MARPLRLDQENTFYHVINRGNERRAIFRDDADREGFLARLGRCSERFELEIFAYEGIPGGIPGTATHY